MRADYEKPMVYIDDFTVSQSIAAGCGAVAGGNTLGKPTHWDKTTCGWNNGVDVLWTDANQECHEKVPDYAEVDGVCYNNPGGGNSIFSS